MAWLILFTTASPEQRSPLEKQFYDIEFYDPAEILPSWKRREQLD